MGETVELMGRITVNPDLCQGRPCVRGMRIRVIDIAGRRLVRPVLAASALGPPASRWSRSAGASPGCGSRR